jgi:hypothetical protein
MVATNTLVWYDTATIMAIKSFITHALGGSTLKMLHLGKNLPYLEISD